MRTAVVLGTLVLACVAWSSAQVETVRPSDKGPGQTEAPPRSDTPRGNEESSSRDTRIDIRPPKDDAKNHPFSTTTGNDDEADNGSDVQEFKPWDPHRAMKDVEVGDFYFKKKNYRAALDRYKEALYYKNNDAMATFRMAQCLEKLNQPEDARTHYEEYLKILPQGPFADEAQKALARLNGEPKQSSRK
ncbi:MAG TPA: tetratricopeptide repeat protein [Terriglobales bacterium]|nr:tetratricopeptide repeat protein [Terriglobales bacterium]